MARHRWNGPLKPKPKDCDAKHKCVKCGMTRLTWLLARRTYCEYKRGNKYIDMEGPFMNKTPSCDERLLDK